MKRIIFILLLIFFVFIIQNLFHSIYSLWQKQELLVNAKNELEKEQRTNQSLRQQIDSVKQPSFIEEQARDKLLLIKPGEQMVIIPKSLIVSEEETKKSSVNKKPNWQQWRELFLNK
jgi:cell division protein FtsB